MTTITSFRQYKEHLYNNIITLILFTKSASKIVSVDVVFHEKQRAIKFFPLLHFSPNGSEVTRNSFSFMDGLK